MTKKTCTHEYLAANHAGKVLICRDCGVVHLHLLNMSLHFNVEQFADFAAMMSEASKRLDPEPIQKSRIPPKLTVVH